MFGGLGAQKQDFGPSFGPSVSPYILWTPGMWILNSKFWKFAQKTTYIHQYIAHVCHTFQIAPLQTSSCSFDNKSYAIFERYD